MITQKRLKEVLHYNPSTGDFIRVRHTGSNDFKDVGSIVGSKSDSGYLITCIDGRKYRLHRLAFLWMEGDHPKDQVDHINHNRSDNRWCNLQHSSDKLNRVNQSKGKLNTSGFIGVSMRSDTKKWTAYIMVSRKKINLGSFIQLSEAVKARINAEKKYGFHINHGRI